MDDLKQLQNNAHLALAEPKVFAGVRKPEENQPEATAESQALGHNLISEAGLREALGKLAEELRQEYGARVEVCVADDNKLIVRIMSRDGTRVFRQLPPESILRFRAGLKENRGLLGDWMA
jgi:uncharacterized FlaG/YvyC family protein